ncbi:hypothetical protein Tco_0986130 [Tanacetum coccineum]
MGVILGSGMSVVIRFPRRDKFPLCSALESTMWAQFAAKWVPLSIACFFPISNYLDDLLLSAFSNALYEWVKVIPFKLMFLLGGLS